MFRHGAFQSQGGEQQWCCFACPWVSEFAICNLKAAAPKYPLTTVSSGHPEPCGFPSNLKGNLPQTPKQPLPPLAGLDILRGSKNQPKKLMQMWGLCST
jgi:hypothetical protein